MVNTCTFSKFGDSGDGCASDSLFCSYLLLLFALFEISLQLSIDFCTTFKLEDNLKFRITEQQKRVDKFAD